MTLIQSRQCEDGDFYDDGGAAAGGWNGWIAQTDLKICPKWDDRPTRSAPSDALEDAATLLVDLEAGAMVLLLAD